MYDGSTEGWLKDAKYINSKTYHKDISQEVLANVIIIGSKSLLSSSVFEESCTKHFA